jgi:RecJ-like exonuclease
MEKVRNYILNNGGQINELPFGKRFTQWNGEDVSSKNYKIIVRFSGVGLIGYDFPSLAKRLESKGVLNMVKLGYSHCPKCTGTGVTHYTVDNGRCFKCNGSGYVE